MPAIIHLRTKVVFGENAVSRLGEEIRARGKRRALLVMGGGSALKNGAYADACAALRAARVSWVEHRGVKPNPEAAHVQAGAAAAVKSRADCVVAVGGGSVADSAKVIAALAANPGLPGAWAYVKNPARAKNAPLPTFCAMTVSGTGSESNGSSVITNPETAEKRAVASPASVPVAAFMDPRYTRGVPAWHTAAGAYDTLATLLERAYGDEGFAWTREYLIGTMRTVLAYAKAAVDFPDDLEARANLMAAATMANSGLGDFLQGANRDVHALEHGVSAVWGVTHGAGIALLLPAYVKARAEADGAFAARAAELGRALFGPRCATALSLAARLRRLATDLGLPARLSGFPGVSAVAAADRDRAVAHALTTPNGFLAVSPAHAGLLRQVAARVLV